MAIPVPSKMLVEQDPHQTRVAILEDDRLAELYIERQGARGVVGNVHTGRVSRVLPGMQAAFVDIGLERDAFLYVADVREELTDLEEAELGEERGNGAGGDRNGGPVNGNGGDRHAHGADQPSIDELLRTGQEIVVQALKDPLPNKGARVSTHVTLPGRYLVYAPTGHHRGVSRRIEDADERARLRELALALGIPGGWIVRTAAEGKGEEEFRQDAAFLLGMWQRISGRAERASGGTVLHYDLDVALRVVRDTFGPEFSVLWVEGEETYTRIVEFLDQVQPLLLDRVRLYRQERPLFERFGIDEAIEEALKPKVWLKSGGHIVINPTEALVAIDVNTGRFVGGQNLEETILQTNLEAVHEIVRQVRLRNLGGILVLDLIDMTVPEHRQQVFTALEEDLKRDRAKNKVLSISEFGLVELTRKRSRPSLERQLTQPCPYCESRGRIKSAASVAFAVRRQVLRHCALHPGAR
ncbi:MAG TPA: Rne/Rng family ribonuclease, partial [Thermoanaerobaculia bacterium]|nr:Rne/Rng family ribonuclease [Thermoanaerobaculia bacterium]